MTVGFVFFATSCSGSTTNSTVAEKKYIYFSTSVIELYENESKAFVLYREGVEGEASFYTSDSEIAIVENGVVLAKGLGECKLTAKVGDYSTSCKIIVSRHEPFQFVTFGTTEKNLIVGEKFELFYTAENADFNEVEFSTSNPNIVEIENKQDGSIVVKAIGVGRTEIVGKLGVTTAKCMVSVYNSSVKKLQLPQVTVNGRVISFQKTNIIDGIYYRIGNSAWVKTTESIEVTDPLPIADLLKVQCKAYSNNMSYIESDVIEVEIYGELYVHEGENGVCWNARTNASNYDVIVDGVLVSENQTECFYASLTDDDIYNVQVVADTGEKSNLFVYFPTAYSPKVIADMSEEPSFSTVKNHNGKYESLDGRSVLRITSALNWGPNRYFGIFVGDDEVTVGDKIYFESKIGDASIRVKTGEETVEENGESVVKDVTTNLPIGPLTKYISTTSADIYSIGYGASRNETVNLIDGWVKNTITLSEKSLYDSDGHGKNDTILIGYRADIATMTDLNGNSLDASALLELIESAGYDIGLTTDSHVRDNGWISYPLYIADIYLEHFSPLVDIEKAIDEFSNTVAIDELNVQHFETILSIRNRYEALKDKDKLEISNYAIFEVYCNEFYKKFYVEVIFDGTEAGFDGEILAKTSVTTSYEEDEVYGNYLKITGNADKQSGAYFNIASEKDYLGYTIFAPVQTSRDSRKWYYSTTSKSGYSSGSADHTLLTTTSAEAWDMTSWTLSEDCSYITLCSAINTNHWFKIGSIYAVKEK